MKKQLLHFVEKLTPSLTSSLYLENIKTRMKNHINSSSINQISFFQTIHPNTLN
jgi:hypothetical protein